MNKIQLKQNAVIQHDLLNVGKMVDERIKELNIDNLVATDDTVKALKNLRSELNKEFKDFEEQRKVIKTLVAQPYSDLEDVYKIQVSEKYTGAISTLKDLIDTHEIKIKKKKQDVLEEYFIECRDMVDADYVKFSDTGITVNLSTSIKNYRDQIDAFFARILDDLNLIETQENEAEILVEYRKDLNCSRSIKEVVERKAKEKLEKERQEAIEQERRFDALDRLGFEFKEFESAFINTTHTDFYMSADDVETRSKIEFDAMLESLKSNIKARETAPVAKAPVKIAEPTSTSSYGGYSTEPISVTPKEEPKLLTSRFEVTGTLEELQALASYIKQNNLTYKNI